MTTTDGSGVDGFVTAGGYLTLVGCLLATATPVAAGASTAFTGSLVTSGLLGTVFAARNLQCVRAGAVALAPAVLSTVFGGWFMAAPLLYDVGFLPTAGTQFAGLLVAAFGGYAVVHSLDR
jgi:hypothetical protein